MAQMKYLLVFWMVCNALGIMAQDKPAYRLLSAEGKPMKYRKALKLASEADIICFGELHNNPIAHWLQLELLHDLTAARGADQLVAGAEMFETHQQPALTAYFAGEMEQEAFEDSLKLWPNYATDYRPVVEFCREKKIPFIATNVPRQYARQVSRQGIDSLQNLPAEELSLLVPLPFPIDYELPGYAAMREMLSGHGGDLNPEFFIAAQAIKDATMAHNILKNWQAGKLFYHLNGAYHSDNQEGITWYVRKQAPEANIVTISVVEQEDISSLSEENRNKADLIIVVPERMTKTY